jgi:feruloyl esterase
MRRLAMMAGLLALVSAAHPGAARAADCAGLARLKIETTNLLSAVEVPAAGDLPAYCRVLGYVRPAINFELRLPLTGWNGKFYQAGCGGFCGTLNADAPGFTNAVDVALRRNYAVAADDSGHWGTSSVDGRWALDNPVAKADWAWRGETETARVGKALVKAFYGTPQTKAYFAGCSTGGRMAGVEATRFPADFDGIIMGAPALDYTGLVATLFAWVAQANTGSDGKPVFGAAKLPMLRDAVLKACHATDGLVSDPRACDFRPESLQCQSADGPDCLTAAEVATLRAWYDGPRDSQGRQLYPGGLPPGSEANWGLWLTGAGGRPPLMPLFGRDFLRYMAFLPDAGPLYTAREFNFDRDPARLAPMAELYNAATWLPGTPGEVQGGEVQGADLSAFAKRGGRMIVYHGWGDPLVTPYLTVAWYEAWAKAAGGLEQARDAARLFMIPGMDHCGINQDNASITDTGIDPLSALEQWVEQGRAPDWLLATKRTRQGQTVWQRPVCAWPAAARLTGGDPAQAAAWTCVVP